MSAEAAVAALVAGERGAGTAVARAFDEDRPATLKALTMAAAASREALDVLLGLIREHRIVHPPIRRYLIADDDVDAAEQQTMVSVAAGCGSYSGAGSAEAWMKQIAANEAKMLIRSRARHDDRAAGSVDDLAGEFVQRLSTMVANAETIRQMLDSMRPDWRRALELREEGLSYEEVAASLDVPIGTAKTWVRRARRELADLVIAKGAELR